MRAPDGVADRGGQAVAVVGAQHPGRQVGERLVEDGLVGRPQVPLGGIGAELDVGDRPQRRGARQLLGVHGVVRRESVRRPGVGRADVDEGDRGGIGSERLAHEGESRTGVGDDGSLAVLESLTQERDRRRHVLLHGVVDERVVP
jgi:hypothetical protein